MCINDYNMIFMFSLTFKKTDRLWHAFIITLKIIINTIIVLLFNALLKRLAGIKCTKEQHISLLIASVMIYYY